MATTQGMNGFDVKAVVSELNEKLPLWVDKIYQFDTRTLGIRFNGEQHAKYQLIIEAGRRTHLVKELPEPPKNPPHFAMLLRKYISGGKVLAIRQHGLERILIFTIGKHDSNYNLIIELFDDGNVILTDWQDIIVQPLHRHRFKDRDIVSGVPYVLSTEDHTSSLENFTEFLQKDSRDVVRALAVGCMLGGTYAEFVCRDAKIDKITPARDANPRPIYSATRDLIERVLHNREPIISAKGCDPINIENSTDVTQFPSFNAALEAYYPITKTEIVQKAKAKLPKEEIIRRHQEEALKKFDTKISKNERIVAAIYENYQLVSNVITTLSKESKKRSWQEIANILKTNPTGIGEKIVAVYPDKHAVELDLGERVTIHVNDGVEQNASRYYDEIKKYRRKKEGALSAMTKPVVRKKAMKHDIIPLKKRWYHKFRWFITTDGVVVLGGRDASQNEELVKKYMAGGDLFVHADVHGASVVIVKGKTERMDEVVQFAASYSGAWRSGHFSADVYSALPEQVSKTPEHGEYVSRGSFIVRGERTYFHNVSLAITIGLQLDPQASVIGGPPVSVHKRTKLYVDLKPGQFEPNDVAKKILRILKEKLPEDEFKGLKSVLNTDGVAAFVPPGGSDILGRNKT